MVSALDFYASLGREINESTRSRLLQFVRERHPQLLDDVVHFTVCHDGDLFCVHSELSGCVLEECAMAGRHC